ncbi:hypothetical protein CORC01_11568 [Colletotrichum orchidophilum]|uniref:Uncharacterized protein n=1 Tax=Colletotrichum orchidophilum TaxID=1209926 RepID=A0A1G4AVN1_9PEZI|nr:uncharacterized protein CORC01_11568 [Colletotrichum orchidophilum]OHE93156.1 hypothetical protein CORC01_11568 [Colletotrichum orchidophilum]
MANDNAPIEWVEVIWKIGKPGPKARQNAQDLLKAHWKTATLNQRPVTSLLIRSLLHNTTKTTSLRHGKPCFGSKSDGWHVTTSWKKTERLFITAHGYTNGPHDFNPKSSTLGRWEPKSIDKADTCGNPIWPAEPLDVRKYTREYHPKVFLDSLIREDETGPDLLVSEQSHEGQGLPQSDVTNQLFSQMTLFDERHQDIIQLDSQTTS